MLTDLLNCTISNFEGSKIPILNVIDRNKTLLNILDFIIILPSLLTVRIIQNIYKDVLRKFRDKLVVNLWKNLSGCLFF